MEDSDLRSAFNKVWIDLIAQGQQEVIGSRDPEAVQDALAKAMTYAIAHPGCEVRVTAESTPRAAFYFQCMATLLGEQGLWDEEATQLMQIELTNGSCILLGIDETDTAAPQEAESVVTGK